MAGRHQQQQHSPQQQQQQQHETMWQRTKHQGKAGFDKVWGWADKLGDPVNKLSNKLGSEAFWPMAIDKESDKAARILSSFCKDGFEKEAPSSSSSSSSSSAKPAATADGPRGKQFVLKKIPPEVIRNARGLAIFTTMRTGLYVSGASGSGVLVARLPDGSWSPPSGILLHTAGFGFLVGVDVYDCVLVLNTAAAVAAFSQVRCTVGGEVSAAAGPVGLGGMVDSEVLHRRQAPLYTYIKSRGLYAGVQLDGTVVVERCDENERFYGERVGVDKILRNEVVDAPVGAIAALWRAVEAAEGRGRGRGQGQGQGGGTVEGEDDGREDDGRVPPVRKNRVSVMEPVQLDWTPSLNSRTDSGKLRVMN